MTHAPPKDQNALRWALLVPMKPLDRAKGRLAVEPPPLRAELVLAMACDTVTAASTCPLVDVVLVVADSAAGLDPLQRLGATVVVDPQARGLGGDHGLNESLCYAAGVAGARDSDYGIASLVADVAAVTPDQLTRVLRAASLHERSFVPDAAGVGTTLVASRHWATFLPEYGEQSRQRHVLAGFAEITEPDINGLRLDVDTIADLAAAAALGAGPQTRTVLDRGRPPLQ